MRKQITVILSLIMLFNFKSISQVYINDDFTTWPQGWAFYGSPCSGQYSGVQELSTGATLPSAKILKSNCLSPCASSVEAGFKKSVSFSPSATQFIFSVKYEANSATTASTVTNAWLKIFDHTNNDWIVSTCLVCGGTLESGWRSYTDTFDIACYGTDSLTIYLYTVDVWTTTPWCKMTRFDTPYLEVTQTSTTAPLVILDIVAHDPTCNGCNDGSIDFTYGGGVAPYALSWTPNVGVTGPGGIIELTADTYSVCITDSNTCDLCYDVILRNPPTAIEDFNSEEIKFYPQPLSNSSILSVPVSMDNKDFVFSICDLSGREIKNYQIRHNLVTVEKGNIAGGIYLGQIKNREGKIIYSMRFSVE